MLLFNLFANFGIAIASSLLWAFLLKIVTPAYIIKIWKESEA
jgi:hypothetical protein